MAPTLFAGVFPLTRIIVSVLVCQTPLASFWQLHREGEHQENEGRIGESLSFFGPFLYSGCLLCLIRLYN